MEFLVAVDGSDAAANALAYAADVATAMDADLTVVHAVDPSVFEEGGEDPIASLADADDRLVMEGVEDAEQRGLTLLEEAAARAAERGHDPATELVYGDPAGAIADYADAEDVDAIYVGHRGRSPRTDVLVGSVAKSVVERASVPVTVVR